MTAFAAFRSTVEALKPRTAVVFGSGLAAAAGCSFQSASTVDYGDVPELVPPTVAGHPGRLVVGTWGPASVLVCLGRMHAYEGHPPDRVTRLVRLAAELQVRVLILTNAAGGLRPDLGPGSLMPISKHLMWIGPDAWRTVAREPPPYSTRLLDFLSMLAPTLSPGTYAALTGPCYETPAEIRALQLLGADAVGMSTALEADAAAGLGLEVAAISCITNQAAGMSDQPLSHTEVQMNAQLAVGRLGNLLGSLVATIR